VQLRSDWQAQKDVMMKIADAMPENKFGYRSTAAQRNIRRADHARRAVERRLLKVLGGNAAAPGFHGREFKRRRPRFSKHSVDSYDYGTALMNELSETTVLEPVKDPPPWLGAASHARIVWTLLAHSMDIYGQMAVYLRLNGIVPPASEGCVVETS
jgi:hypothetical protein